MKKLKLVLLLVIACALTAQAGPKEKGVAKLKDLQPTGTTDKKNKNQQFDFTFDASSKEYVCRTSHKTSLKATDYVVGNDVQFEVNNDKAKLKNSAGKEIKCTVVRVENLPATPK